MLMRRPYLTCCLAVFLAVIASACSSGEALTPKQQQSYDELIAKHQAVIKERAELHQRLEQQYRENSKTEKSKNAIVKDAAACGISGTSAKLDLKTFKKRPGQLSFKGGGRGKTGCDGLKAQVK